VQHIITLLPHQLTIHDDTSPAASAVTSDSECLASTVERQLLNPLITQPSMKRGTALLSAPLLFAISAAFSREDVAQIPPIDNYHSILRGRSQLLMSEGAIHAVRHKPGFQVLSWNTAEAHKLPCLCTNRWRNVSPALKRTELPLRMTRGEPEFNQRVSLNWRFDSCLTQNLMVIVNAGHRWSGPASENSRRNLESKDELRGQSRPYSRRLVQV
jgi:hypothetical protein